MQNQEIEAVDALLLSGLRDNPGAGLTFMNPKMKILEQDEEDAATSMSFFGNDTDMDSMKMKRRGGG